MNKDEIKEKLNYFRKYNTFYENTMITEIENYINNLQEENKRLKFTIQDTYDSANDTCGELQQRIDKAIGYIIERYDYQGHALTHTFDKDNVRELLKILKGEKNE